MTIPPMIELLLHLKRCGIVNVPGLDDGKRDAAINWLKENAMLVADPGYRITARGDAWLDMILETPLPVQQWIDPRAALPDLGEFRGTRGDGWSQPAPGLHVKIVEPEPPKPSLPPLPEGFTAWGGELGTVFDPGLKQDVKVTVPNGIGVDATVAVFQRNGKVRNVKGQEVFPAGSINWTWAKPLPADRIPPGGEAKAAERLKRQQAEDVIGYAVIPGQDDHLRRDL